MCVVYKALHKCTHSSSFPGNRDNCNFRNATTSKFIPACPRLEIVNVESEYVCSLCNSKFYNLVEQAEHKYGVRATGGHVLPGDIHPGDITMTKNDQKTYEMWAMEKHELKCKWETVVMLMNIDSDFWVCLMGRGKLYLLQKILNENETSAAGEHADLDPL